MTKASPEHVGGRMVTNIVANSDSATEHFHGQMFSAVPEVHKYAVRHFRSEANGTVVTYRSEGIEICKKLYIVSIKNVKRQGNSAVLFQNA